MCLYICSVNQSSSIRQRKCCTAYLTNVHPTFHHRNPQHASLLNPEFGAICLDPPPTCEKLNRLILAGPLAGPRAFVCLASLCCWCSFYLSIFFTLSLSIRPRLFTTVAEHCEIGVSDYGAVLAGKNLAIFQASSYPGCPTFIQD